MLSVSGLRLGEARKLRVDDVDLDAGVLTVRHAKFGKSRLVPLHASKLTADGYLMWPSSKSLLFSMHEYSISSESGLSVKVRVFFHGFV